MQFGLRPIGKRHEVYYIAADYWPRRSVLGNSPSAIGRAEASYALRPSPCMKAAGKRQRGVVLPIHIWGEGGCESIAESHLLRVDYCQGAPV